MGKYKTLVNNTIIFAVCNFTSKLLVFIMLPFYTAELSKEEFGASDMILTTIGLLQPFLTLCVAEACLRFAIDKSEDTCQVFSITIKVVLFGVLFLFILYPFLSLISSIRDYYVWFVLLYIAQTINLVLNMFCRGINRVKLVGVAGVVSSFCAVGSNIILLFVLHLGVVGYVLSFIIAYTIANTVMFVGGEMCQYITKQTPMPLAKEMMSYSIPLMPNQLGWWVNQSSNRYFLNAFCTVADVGIYSAAAKLPSIIDVFRGFFVQAWQLSMISEFENNESKAFFINIFKVYNTFIILSCSLLIVLSKVVAHMLYSEAFFEAWNYTPLLLLGILFSSLIAYYSPIYLAYKKTSVLFRFTLAGAATTILLNWLLVPKMSIYGAAIGTVGSSFVIFTLMAHHSKKYVDFGKAGRKYYLSYLVITIQTLIITFLHVEPYGFWSLLCLVSLFAISIKDLKELFSFASNSVFNKNHSL